MDQEKKQPTNQYDPIAETKSKLLFVVIALGGLLICKFILGW